MNGKQNTEFEKVSDLTATSTLKWNIPYFPTLMIKTEPPKKQWKSKKKTNEFFEKPSDEEEFEGQIIEDILEPYEHKKIKNPYVNRKPQDAQTIVYETKNDMAIF